MSKPDLPQSVVAKATHCKECPRPVKVRSRDAMAYFRREPEITVVEILEMMA